MIFFHIAYIISIRGGKLQLLKCAGKSQVSQKVK